jgi:hypothetical protein
LPRLRSALTFVAVLTAAALLAPPAQAAVIPEPGADYFERGIAQYRAGDYASALYLFQAARSSGNRNPNLRYDIALTLFQLGRDAEARREFEALYFEPGYESIADYHLGLIAARAGDRESATATLRRTAQGAPLEPLRQLAAAALVHVEGAMPPETFAAYGSLGGGYDSNAGYQSDDVQEVSDSADSFYEGIGVVDYPLGRGQFLMGNLYAREYADLPDYSQQTAQAGWRVVAGAEGWVGTLAARVETSRFGGESLHDAGMLAVEGRRGMGPGYITVRVSSARFAAGDLFPELDGWRHRLGAEYATWRGAIGYELELNNRADLEEEAAFASRSPTRHALSARTSRALGGNVSLEWRGRYRYSSYGDADRFGGFEKKRADSLAEIAFATRWRVTPLWSLLAEARYARNGSSLDHYEYARGSGLLGLEVTM